MAGAEGYLQKALEIAQRAAETQVGPIRVAAGLVVEALTAGKRFWVFGTGHSHALAEVLLETNEIAAGDVVLIASNSGRNAVPVEFALGARKRGAQVIVLTSMAHSTATTSRAPGGQRLFETADVVIDNCGVPSDALIEVNGSPEKTGATSTMVGAMLVQALTVEIVTRLTERGETPNVLRSLNG